MKFLPLLAGFTISLGALAQNQNEFNKADVDNSLKAKLEEVKPDSTKNWKFGSTININFTNTGLVNWQGGGQDALTLTGNYVGFANYAKNNHNWNNRLEMGYGLTRLGTKEAAVLRKSEDRLVITSKYARMINKNWGFAGLLDFRTQFDYGYKYDVDVKDADGNVIGTEDQYISNFLAPAYMVTSAGFEYKNGEMFYAMISPVTSKLTIVNSQVLNSVGAYGVDTGKVARSEFGAYLNSTFKYKLMDNITYNTNLNLFMNYKTPKLIDIFWDNTLLFTVNKYITATFNTNLIYDDDIKILNSDGVTSSPKIQFKHVLAVGFIYKLI